MKKLNKKEKELYKRCDEVLHYLWDPIGSKEIPGARDEYHGYLPHIFKLVLEDFDKIKIANHLSQIEKVSMGLNSRNDKNKIVAHTLLDWKEWIWDGHQ